MPSTRGVVVKNDPQLAHHVQNVVAKELDDLFEKNLLQKAKELVHMYERKLRLTEDYKSLALLFEKLTAGFFKNNQPFIVLDELEYYSKKKHCLMPALETLVNSISNTYQNYFNDKNELEKFLYRFVETIEGKIYAEKTRSQAITLLSKLAEEKQEFLKAKDLLLMTHIETMSSLDYQSKTKFILEQMRLCIRCKDFMKLELLSKKINSKFLNEDENQDLLILFYEYMIQASIALKKYSDSITYFYKLYKCSSVQNDNERKLIVMKLLISASVYSDSDQKIIEIIDELRKDEDIAKIPIHFKFIKLYSSSEVIQISYFDKIFRHEIYLKEGEPLMKMVEHDSVDEAMIMLDKQLRKRNIKIFSIFFQTITLKSVSELLECTPDEAEDLLVEMIVDSKINCLINRLGEITLEFGHNLISNSTYDHRSIFNQNKASDNSVDDFCMKVSDLIKEIYDINYLIKNEEMIHSAE